MCRNCRLGCSLGWPSPMVARPQISRWEGLVAAGLRPAVDPMRGAAGSTVTAGAAGSGHPLASGGSSGAAGGAIGGETPDASDSPDARSVDASSTDGPIVGANLTADNVVAAANLVAWYRFKDRQGSRCRFLEGRHQRRVLRRRRGGRSRCPARLRGHLQRRRERSISPRCRTI